MSRPLQIITRSALPAMASAALVLLSAGAVVAAEPIVEEVAAKDENAVLQSLLFPEGSGFSITTFKATPAKEDVSPTKPGRVQSKEAVTEWTVSGVAKEEAMERLAGLNTRTGITRIFHEVAEATGNQEFLKSTDSLVVNVRTLENPGYKAPATKAASKNLETAFQLVEKEPAKAPAATEDSGYPFTFQLVITRRSAAPTTLSK